MFRTIEKKQNVAILSDSFFQMCHNTRLYNNQHNDTQHNRKNVTLSIMAIDTVMLGVVCSKWPKAECGCANSSGVHSKLEYNNVFII
jgi:hypothetical protein